MAQNLEFAIVDVETTGLFPARNDRVIEVAVLRVDSSGHILREFTTLVNPHRDMGPTNIHGITTTDVKSAPTFEEIAGNILSLLAGAVFVGHNVHFDKRFIHSEMNRLGYRLPDHALLCTMQLARKVDPHIPSRKLTTLCNYFGIRLDSAHSAYADATATASLFALCVSKICKKAPLSTVNIGIKGNLLPKEAWPEIPAHGIHYHRKQAAKDQALEESYIDRVVAKLPAIGGPTPNFDQYHIFLDQVLEDRRVTLEEADELLALANDLGMSSSQVTDANNTYMAGLIRVALADDVITAAERRDLESVRTLLGIPKLSFISMIDAASKGQDDENTNADLPIFQGRDLRGKTVCFTGQLACRIDGQSVERPYAEHIADSNGMVVSRTVTKALDYLVAADPDSMSGKANKARKYGVRIIAESVFWQLMGIDVE